MNLEEKLKQLPSDSGIYQYFDKNNHLLYIGKAKTLKNRVKSYFKFTPTLQPAEKLNPRIFKMISETVSLQWIVTPNEHDALILENSLIKQLKPKYNILLRDDKTYPYIMIDYAQLFPRLEITRRVFKSKNIKYFGPYSTGAKDMLDSIYEIVPLVQKKSCIKDKKACLFHQIKKCYAPCEGKISTSDYAKVVQEACDYIYNKSKLIKKLDEKMTQYSEELRFEDAMKLRDRIKSIEKSQIKSTVDLASNEELDLFAIKAGKKKAVVVRMFIREGRITSSSHDFIKIDFLEDNKDIDLSEAYKRAIINYYDNEIPLLPKEIIIAKELEDKTDIEEFLKNRFDRNITISTPKIGKKRSLIDIAVSNCNELLRIDNTKNQTTIYEELKNLFNLQTLPYTIESYDNSHMMGQATVGALVAWSEELNGFNKKEFRHYNLESKDEYSQMREMLIRRTESFEKSSPPDLCVIDGGETLLKLAYDIINSSGANLDIIAIAKEKIDAKAHRAKGSANDIIHYKDKQGNIRSLKLKPSDQRLHFVQRLRDEAHRFVINYHKKQKRKEDKQVSLLQINGIGEAKVKKLLLYFGEFEKIKTATFEELTTVINEKDANLIIDYFKKQEDK